MISIDIRVRSIAEERVGEVRDYPVFAAAVEQLEVVPGDAVGDDVVGDLVVGDAGEGV